MADDLQKFNFGSWAESIAGSVARNWAKNKFMPKQPKMDYYFDKQFDQAKQDMTRTIAENLSKRGMSGATDITAEALRPVSDLEAQRAYLRGQVDYQNDMQDYNDKAQFWGEIIPTLFSYKDNDDVERMGPFTGIWDEASKYAGEKMPVIDGWPTLSFNTTPNSTASKYPGGSVPRTPSVEEIKAQAGGNFPVGLAPDWFQWLEEWQKKNRAKIEPQLQPNMKGYNSIKSGVN